MVKQKGLKRSGTRRIDEGGGMWYGGRWVAHIPKRRGEERRVRGVNHAKSLYMFVPRPISDTIQRNY